MNVVIVTNSTSYEPRAERVADFFRGRGHQVQLVESDFFHREKFKEVRPPKPGYHYIDTIPYKKNLSAARLYSHYNFAEKAFRALTSGQVAREPIDLLYVMVPANSLTRMAARYKRRHPETKLVLDIIDLWPESLPIPVIKNIFPCTVWRNLRDRNLEAADRIFTECELYQEVLEKQLQGLKVETLYWPKEMKVRGAEQAVLPADTPERDKASAKSNHRIHIAYIGSMNHILDMENIVILLRGINSRIPVMLHVIGDGERREEFLEAVAGAQIAMQYYGTVYDEEKKRVILEPCMYGLNLMKDTVCVGLTMKSVDYLSYGLKLLNNIPGDTWKVIETEAVGYNYQRDNVETIADTVATEAAGQIMSQAQKKRVQMVYEKLFSVEAFEKRLEKALL